LLENVTPELVERKIISIIHSDLLAYLYHLVHTIICEMSRAKNQQRMERFFAAHREGGLPVTTQRRAVFEAIQARTDHPTAEQLYRAVRAQLPQVSRMTVHRILGAFVSLGLVARTCHPGSAARFDPKLHQHHHLVCLSCGRIVDVEDPRLNRIRWPEVKTREFQIEDYNIHFRGRCCRCRQKPRARRQRTSNKAV
jgi:Fur family transcriptional regulator, peroxide stress response regulator